MGIESNNDDESAAAEDPLPPLDEAAPIMDRAIEIRTDTEPRKGVRQRLGTMAAKRSTEPRYDGGTLVEQNVIAQMRRDLGRSVMRGSVRGPHAA